jgi:prefoldin subunit 5
MMSDKDCKDLEKTLDNLRGPNDLEEKIRVLEFRNAKLHQHNEKIEREILELRDEIKRLEKEVSFYAKDQFRNQGDM